MDVDDLLFLAKIYGEFAAFFTVLFLIVSTNRRLGQYPMIALIFGSLWMGICFPWSLYEIFKDLRRIK